MTAEAAARELAAFVAPALAPDEQPLVAELTREGEWLSLALLALHVAERENLTVTAALSAVVEAGYLGGDLDDELEEVLRDSLAAAR